MDAIVIASDILSQAYQDLARLAATTGPNVISLGNSGRATAIGLCWSIIDQLHAVRQLLEPPPRKVARLFTQRFLDASEPATRLRNKMDHLRANLDNLANKKGYRSPLFGELGYVLSKEDPASGGFLITISSGSSQGNEQFLPPNPARRQYTTPVGLLQLHAFDITFEFSSAFAALQDYIKITDANIEKLVRSAAAKEALKGCHTVDELISHLGSLPAIVAEFDFVSDES